MNEYLSFVKRGALQMNDLIHSISTLNQLKNDKSNSKAEISLQKLLDELVINFNSQLYPDLEITY